MEGFNADWMPTGCRRRMTLRPAPMTAEGMIVVIVVPAALPW